jgi:hypothetical protein
LTRFRARAQLRVVDDGPDADLITPERENPVLGRGPVAGNRVWSKSARRFRERGRGRGRRRRGRKLHSDAVG